jgi:Txe/YoeB family toxin of toxin-antitoxin system
VAISASEARSRLFPLIQQVNDDHVPVRINSKGGGDLSGYWSRRIDDEHRLVYRADDKEVKILKARYQWPGPDGSAPGAGVTFG